MTTPVNNWPKKAFYWVEGRTLHVSIPFTWNLPEVMNRVKKGGLFWDDVIVGGPAVQLMPGFFDSLDYVTEVKEYNGVLQKIKPDATRTTTGCIRKCKFCAIGTRKIEPIFKELDDWPDGTEICDNNLLAASNEHFDKVVDRLIKHGTADFNQGLDSRLLTDHHAKRLKEIKKPMIRLALDHMDYADQWQDAFDRLRDAGIALRHIRSYCIVGFNSDPKESWTRCHFVESHNIKELPMWYHTLDQLEWNIVTTEQKKFGWNNEERLRIMGFYYHHRGVPPKYIKTKYYRKK